MTRRDFFRNAGAAALVSRVAAQEPQRTGRPPNIVLIYCDDLGYGDIGPFGSKIETPTLTRMATEGVMLRQFCASPVCSVSRATLLTGRYGVRTGVPGVMHPGDSYGMAQSEVTIANMLKNAGYKTSCIGKWHLGTAAAHMPTRRGFDEYFGIPYSNDQEPSVLIRGVQVVESPVVQDTITQRYTEAAVDFISRSKDSPFFLYLPHTFPHTPLAASAEFRGKSKLGLYGDAIMEIDWSTGRILETLANLGLDNNTLVMFSSDNGPWFQGSPGRLRGRKGGTFEGGVRVPFLARFPKVVPAGKTVDSFASTLDILPTIAELTGAELPDNPLDGVSIVPVLTGAATSVTRPLYLYFREFELQCARLGKWKLHVARENAPPDSPVPPEGRLNLRLLSPELYDMDDDPEESYNVAAANPRVVADIQVRILAMLPTLPAGVQFAWQRTQSRPVGGIKDGEWPSLLQN